MAKSLQERLASARETDRTTIETLAKLIDDVHAERERLTAAHERASADSIDFALSEADREEAATNAGRYARSLAALAGAAEELEGKLEAKRNSDAQRAKQADKASALAERDEIAARFADRVPLLVAELIELLKAVQANEARMRDAGLYEANAEFKARGVSGNGMLGGAPVLQFTTVKLPDFYGAGRAWPADWQTVAAVSKYNQERSDILRGREKEEREKREKAEAAAKFALDNGRYRLSVEMDTVNPDAVVHLPEDLVSGNLPAALGTWETRNLVISHEVAKKLASVPRLKVELVGEARK